MMDWNQDLFYWIIRIGILLVIGKLSLSYLKGRLLKSESSDEPMKKKRVARGPSYTQQYATGWYRMINSNELKRGEVKHICYLGSEMVAFRGMDGKALVADAFCPHLGANLGIGGQVVDNCLKCPFHDWQFDNIDGTCRKIPYQDSIPSNAKLFTYHTVERYGMVVIWWNSADKTGEPHYPFITVPDLDSPDFEYRRSFSYPGIKMHMQEFAENTVDIQHFDILHTQMTIPFTDIPIPFTKIHHESSFRLGEDPWTIYFGDVACLKILGKKYESTTVTAEILFYGPGSITLFRFDGEFGRIYLWHTHTSSDLMEQDVMFNVWSQKKVPRFLSWYVAGNWISQWHRDVFVWENKLFLRKPLLVKGDGPVMKLRRWYQQFYQKDSDSVEW